MGDAVVNMIGVGQVNRIFVTDALAIGYAIPDTSVFDTRMLDGSKYGAVGL